MALAWRDDAPANEARLAVGRCLVATMDASKWRELGLLTDTLSVIEGHHRLLRSLSFGDSDYDRHVFELTGVVLGERVSASDPSHTSAQPSDALSRFPNLATVSGFLALPVWLMQNDHPMFTRLFVAADEAARMPDAKVVSAAEAAAARLQVGEMRRQIERIRRDHSDDPEAAVGQAKELVETTCKTILGLTGDAAGTQEEVPKLVKQTLVHLGLDPAAVAAADGDEVAAHALKRLFGGVASIVAGAAELRNARGTGHGKSRAPEVDPALGRLVVGLVLPAVIYLIEMYEENTRSTVPPPRSVARDGQPRSRAEVAGWAPGVVGAHPST